ncbi:MAG: helix-turn-helix domain-containing protein [Vicingaceae bacterium]|nr:helix-turn-helix domain-containing protein [Vicingaceae bacterium]
MNKKIHIKIKELRKINGFSQAFIADKLGVSQKAYSKIERGDTQLNLEKIKKIALILDLTAWDLIDETKEAQDINLNGEFNDKTIPLLKQLIENQDNKINKLQEEIIFLKERLGER